MMMRKAVKDWDASLAVDFIKLWEGIRLEAYQCSAGVWTIGVGHTKGVKKGDRITLDEAIELLTSDLESFKAEIFPLVFVPISKTQFIALLSFVFNLGVTSFARSTLLKKLNNEDFEGASAEFLRWRFVNGVEVKGLLNRRKAEKELFDKGIV